MGKLNPTLVMECIPGDRFNIGCESLVRFAPLVSPVMHRMTVYMHYFFVPNRILWPNWEKFITNTPITPGGSNIPAAPTIAVNSDLPVDSLKLLDYMGIPIPSAPGSDTEIISALPFAAYQKIYNDFYRDQNLQTDLAEEIQLVDGANSTNLATLTTLRDRCWEHDYFTAALPFAQKGEAVQIPIADFVDVPVRVNRSGVADPITTFDSAPTGAIAGNLVSDGADDVNGLYADTSSLGGTASTINDLRRAFKLQEWLEKAARGGSRYVENILEFFGVRSPDSRLQRPEYVTGTASPVVIGTVMQTGETTDESPQANMAGSASAVTSGKYGYYNCQEHGYIIGIMSIMPKTAYQQGINRTFLKFDTMDYYWPPFANIGEQEVQQRELYAFNGAPGDETFGYVPRYAEYKFMPSRVAGEFRTSLDFWHMGRIFNTSPNLNAAFVQSNPTTRIFAVELGPGDTAIDHLYCHVLHKIRAIRMMPKFGTPTF